jgi:hypothetical protein
MKCYNVLSVDLEFWLSRLLEPKFMRESFEKNNLLYTIFVRTIIEPTMKLLEIFEDASITSTFFITYSVYSVAPKLIDEISKKKHEIAFHGYCHNDPSPLAVQIQKSASFLTQYTVRGYRAPEMHINRSDFPILARYNFVYDSSTYDKTPYKVYIDPYTYLWEIPVSCYPPSTTRAESYDKSLLRRIPIGAGYLFKLMPKRFIDLLINRLNSHNIPTIIFIHQWQLVNPKELLMLAREVLKTTMKIELKKLKIRDLYSFLAIDEKSIKNILKDYYFICIKDLVEYYESQDISY